ncbi:methylated-DNA--[protein]-cysteine S-methyltransferase [Pontimonas sp.]|nr:methylated-DNA--[protein]-cysteine S-methyltransferase [Pontimonas sp.]
MDHFTFESPLGPISLHGHDDHLTGVSLGVAHAHSKPTPLLVRAQQQLTEYLEGERREFDLPVHFSGTPFQEAIWSSLRTIPYGHTESYQALGEKAGRGKAPRAVGGAVGRNPLPIIVPCHRILAADGRITGYSGGDGIPTKKWLLDREGITYR